jgi:amidase
MRRFLILPFVIAVTFACSPEQSSTATNASTTESFPATPQHALAGEIDYTATGIIAKTLPDIILALETGDLSSEDLVQQYLARIDKVDRNGPTLQSILTLNPHALSEAKKRDKERADGYIAGPLHGIPILLKDNIESKDDMPTTAGALALKNNITGRDSPLVAGLRAQGAIILGKTNLSQWANFRSAGSMSGWSALGGQVRNPHMLDRNPCGSSSGSGAATAASLAAATIGTETNGSIICPSNVNGIVGFKPTVGIVSQQYIIPISASQDTAGPMTKTVMGAAIMMNAIATAPTDIDYTANLNKGALSGVRLGILNFAMGDSAAIISQFQNALKELEAAGAILVFIDERPPQPDNLGSLSFDILKYEFKDGINAYLASTDEEQVSTRSLESLIAFNIERSDIELALFDQSIFVESQAMGSLDSKEYQSALSIVQSASREEGIDQLLKEYSVQALVSPSGVIAPRVDPINGDVWPDGWPGYGPHAARAGYPHITIPMGTVHTLPIGLSFIGTANADADLLAYAYAYEQQSLRRPDPQYIKQAEALPGIAEAMTASK